MIETDDGQVPPFPRLDPRRRSSGSTASPRPRAGSATRRSRSSAPTASRAAATAPRASASRSCPERFDPLTYVEGGPPQADDEVVIDKASADDEGFEVGDTVEIAGKEAAKEYTLVGIATLGDVDSFGGATLALLTLPEAQRITGKEGEFDQISVAADAGHDAGAARRQPDRGAAGLGRGRDRRAENVESQRDDVGEFIGFLKTALLIFAGVALFVAAFLIFNTFSITVAQRTREFAMLRTLGANRRQILSSVVIEAFVDRPRRRRSSACSPGSASRPRSARCSSALGIDLPEHRDRDRGPDDRSSRCCSAPG